MLLPSENYAPHGQTQQCLLDSLASDCNKLYAEGIEARYPMMCSQCSVPICPHMWCFCTLPNHFFQMAGDLEG